MDYTKSGNISASDGQQLSLWDAPFPIPTRPPANSSPFSRAAADSIADAAPNLRDRIHAWLIQRGNLGATNEEISLALNLRMSTVSARTCELKAMSWIDEAGERKTSSGRKAAVLVAKKPLTTEDF